jgi:DNA-binding transcriptional regulator LsrR (DeoR family)
MQHAISTGLVPRDALAKYRVPSKAIARRNEKIRLFYLNNDFTHREVASIFGLGKSQASEILKGLKRQTS